MKIKHNTLINAHKPSVIDWNFLRDNPEMSAYYIPFSKEEYINSIKNFSNTALLNEIISYCEKNKINKIISLGAGRCILEYAIKTNSDIKVIVTDNTNSITRIKSYNIFDDAIQADCLRDYNIVADNNTLILLSRIDTEFNDADFKKLFNKFAENNVKYICFLPAELLNLKIFLVEIKILLKSFLTRKKRIFCGYARTESEFIKCWGENYKIDEKNKKIQVYFLKK